MDEPAQAPAADRRPNLVLISIDTLRADHVTAYGYPRETTPAIDRLAAEGVLFERAFSQAPRTAQSHMTLFTGLYPEEHRVKNFQDGDPRRLPASVPTLASILRANGYATYGYVGGGNIAGSLGFDAGFDLYEQRGPRKFEIAAARLTEFASGTIPGRQNLFLFVHTYRTHDPYVSGDPAQVRRFADPAYAGDILETWEALDQAGGKDFNSYQREFWSRVDTSDPDDVRHLIALYDACIRSADDSVGGLLTTLREAGLENDTIVVLLSDHGEEFREHGKFLHEDVHLEALHVPLIFRFPESGAARGLRIREDVRLIDVLPTLLDALGIPTPRHVQGRSLLELIERQSSTPRAAYGQYEKLGYRALRSGGWSLIERPAERRGLRLFGLALPFGSSRPAYQLFARSDVAEQRDLAAEHPEIVRALAAELARARDTMRENGSAVGHLTEAGLDEQTRRQLEALGYAGD